MAPPTDFPGEPREVYLTNFADGVQGITATADLSGKLRQVRSGSTVTGYFRSSGNWVAIHTGPATTADTGFALASFSGDDLFTDQAVMMAFDNFIVTQGQPICPATEFDFALDSLAVDGNILGSGDPDGVADFFDDFDDGSLTTFPTSEFFCLQPTDESGGFLNLRSSDGTQVRPSTLLDNCQLGVETQTTLLQDEGGNSVIDASFRADVPLPRQAYGLTLFGFGPDDAFVTVQVSNCGPGACVAGTSRSGRGTRPTKIPVDLTGVSRIILRIALNDATNEAIPSFSTNAGLTFTELPLVVPETFFTGSAQAAVGVFGFVVLPR